MCLTLTLSDIVAFLWNYNVFISFKNKHSLTQRDFFMNTQRKFKQNSATMSFLNTTPSCFLA